MLGIVQRFYRLFSFLLAILLAGCSADSGEGLAVEFHVSVKSIDRGQVTVIITHNGSNRDTYCGFTVRGEVADVRQAIDNYLATSLSYSDQRSQKKQVVKLGGLAANTTYTFIVFGLTEDEKAFGLPASVTFSTGEGGWTAEENPIWTITYEGPKMYQDNYYSCISVDVAEKSDETYFVGDYLESDVASYGTMEGFLSFAVDDHNRRWQDEDQNAFWKEDFLLRTGSDSHYARLQEKSTYVSFAIGIGADGLPTGHYVRTDPYEVERYPMLPAYAALLYKSYVSTKWELFNESEHQTIPCVLKENVRNESLLMEWSTLTFSSLNRFPVSFSPVDGSLQIGSCETRAGTVERIDGELVSGDLYITGWLLNEQGDTVLSQSPVIARGLPQADDTYLFTSAFSSGKSGMAYVIFKKDETYMLRPGAIITFPFRMRKPQ